MAFSIYMLNSITWGYVEVGGVSMSMTDERVYCTACGQLRHVTDLHKVFQTGFRRIGEMNYHTTSYSNLFNFHKMVGGGGATS